MYKRQEQGHGGRSGRDGGWPGILFGFHAVLSLCGKMGDVYKRQDLAAQLFPGGIFVKLMGELVGQPDQDAEDKESAGGQEMCIRDRSPPF